MLFMLILIVPAVWLIIVKMEKEKPVLEKGPATSFIGASNQFKISISDKKSGLKKLWIGLLKDGKEVTVLEKEFPLSGFLAGGEIQTKDLTVDISPGQLGLSDGKGILRIVVWDYSWRKWGKGNALYVEKEIQIDTKPPVIELLSNVHNIAQGGSGVVIYRTGESCPKSGVMVDDNFFPGHSGHFKDDMIHLAFFALNHNQGKGTKIFVEAWDFAGNSGKSGMPVHINNRKFKQDVINISDRFLNWKLPEFSSGMPDESSMSLLEKFLKVNKDYRADNAKTLFGKTAVTENKMMWKGAFGRLPRSQNRAGFADHRSYKYKGNIVDKQVHLGIDLASTKQSPVPAANSGKVVYADATGIYGKTVLIDHGFGLFSLYSHLSSMTVAPDQMVNKGDMLGKTGKTGLAGGDHLHLSIIIHNTFVNPVEWWDKNWIKHNVTSKIDEVVKK